MRGKGRYSPFVSITDCTTFFFLWQVGVKSSENSPLTVQPHMMVRLSPPALHNPQRSQGLRVNLERSCQGSRPGAAANVPRRPSGEVGAVLSVPTLPKNGSGGYAARPAAVAGYQHTFAPRVGAGGGRFSQQSYEEEARALAKRSLHLSAARRLVGTAWTETMPYLHRPGHQASNPKQKLRSSWRMTFKKAEAFNWNSNAAAEKEAIAVMPQCLLVDSDWFSYDTKTLPSNKG